jgi:hypothetical protein
MPTERATVPMCRCRSGLRQCIRYGSGVHLRRRQYPVSLATGVIARVEGHSPGIDEIALLHAANTTCIGYRTQGSLWLCSES